ncbi:MAG: hypothetical protein HS115_06815 [Spirochaetales bacterium]|nr:hypothetical protein [Spirochaetales bacterium]
MLNRFLLLTLFPLAFLRADWQPEKTSALVVGVLEWQDKGLESFSKKGRKDREL